jgi:HlyD family secretion protein
MTWWKTVILGVLGVGVLGVTVAGLRDRPPPSVEVHVASARKANITRTVVGAGKVQAATTVKISSNLSGDLVELDVKNGDRVSKGQVLARIDPRRFQAAARQMEASEAAAKADTQVAEVDVQRTGLELHRVEELSGRGLSSTAEVEKTKSDRDAALARLNGAKERLAQAAAALEQARTDLLHTTLVAPMDGNVIERDREVGERVRGSEFSEDTVMVVAALSTMEVQFEVGEHDIVFLKPGQEAEITVDALEGQTFKGAVVELAQRATIKNPGTEQEVTTFPVKVAIQSRPPGVLPGMSAEVRVSTQTRNDVVTVPIQAVTLRPERLLTDSRRSEGGLAAPATHGERLAKVVFVLDDEGRAHLRRVETGISSDTELEIVAGLKDGERVVEGPYRAISKELSEGSHVKPADSGGKS